MQTGDIEHSSRIGARRGPTWWLRRRERQIVANWSPTREELFELAAIRSTLRTRGRQSATRWSS